MPEYVGLTIRLPRGAIEKLDRVAHEEGSTRAAQIFYAVRDLLYANADRFDIVPIEHQKQL